MKSPNWDREEVILAAELVVRNDWKQLDKTDEAVIELSRLLSAAPFHPKEVRTAEFRNATGVALKTWNLASLHPNYQGAKSNASKMDRSVVEDFLQSELEMLENAKAIRTLIIEGDFREDNFHDTEDSTEFEAPEGRTLLSKHYRRERSVKLRTKKLAAVKASGRTIACEVCDFDFATSYGERGLEYIEVHHKMPLHVTGERTTKLEDLALLCANCHRMIHRGKWISVEELRAIFVGK